MTFIRRNLFCSCGERKLSFKSLLVYTVIGLLATENASATTQFPILSNCNNQNANVSKLESVPKMDPITSTREIKLINKTNVHQNETFDPNTVLIKPSDRILSSKFNGSENIKITSAKRKNSLNQPLINLHKVKPLEVNASELPAASFIPKLPAHQQLKNISKINLQTRMLFDRSK